MEIIKINMHWLDFSFAQHSKRLRFFFFVFFHIFSLNVFQLAAQPSLPEGISVQLRDPQYSEGTLRTSQGGLITSEGIRIQAQHLLYTRNQTNHGNVCKVEAEGDLLFEFGDYIFVGKRLEYDFQDKTGVIYEGKTAVEPWFFGGERIYLHANGSYTIYNGYLTTSETCAIEWKLTAEEATLYPNRDLIAHQFKFQYYKIPFLWIPYLKVNLDYILDSPIRYSARWGGRQGPRIEFIYEIFDWNGWKTFLKFDYRLTRGPGIGLESYYRSDDHAETFEAINYIARDSSIENPNERFRYRFQGDYSRKFFDDKVSFNLTYDKLSDKYMATDYRDSGLDLEYVGATALKIRRQADHWIANITATMRLNSFQTLKQELPTFALNLKPFNLGATKIISNQLFKASYLDYKYSDQIHHTQDYHSSRIQYAHQLYRTFNLFPLILTPECGGTIIHYGNLPKDNDHWLAMGIFKLEAKAPFFKDHGFYTHSLTPYARYEFYSMPTSTPKKHYIFDIDDGLYQVNMLRFGLQQNFYFKSNQEFIYRPIKIDLYANAFFDSKTFTQVIPKAYCDVTFYATPKFRHTLSTAWDFEHNLLDHFNLRTELTISENAAIATEYRHRSAFCFRKADPTNFMLESYRTQGRLAHSALSDRRDTLLVNLFYRFHPLWALDFQMRHGWNRKLQPNYTEFGIDLLGKPQAAWQVKFSYTHCENDRHRFTVYFNMGGVPPDGWKYDYLIPSVTF